MVSIGRHKTIINFAIKRFKKLYWFYFFIYFYQNLIIFYYFFTNSCNFECIFKNSLNSFKSYKSIKFFPVNSYDTNLLKSKLL